MTTITLPMPPSANRYWRRGSSGTYVSDEAEEYKTEVFYACRAANVKPIAGEIRMTLRIYFPNKRGDLDNRIKILLDALNGLAFGDDKQVTEIHAYRFIDKMGPRAEVTVESSQTGFPG